MLFAALRDTDGRVWKEALEALWIDRRINPTFVADLTAHLTHSNHDVRRMAALALHDVVPWAVPETLPRLAALLSDPDLSVRAAAVHSLEGFGTAAAPAALPVLEGPPPDPKDHVWLWRIAEAVWRIDPRHPDPAAWLLLRPADRADYEALSRAVVMLATRSGFDIGPGLAWVVANGSDTLWPKALTPINMWGSSGLNIWRFPIDSFEQQRTSMSTQVPIQNPLPRADVRGLSVALLGRLRDPRTGPELASMVINSLGQLGDGARAEAPALRQLSAGEADLPRRLELVSTILRIEPDDSTAIAELWNAVTADDSNLADLASELLYDAVPPIHIGNGVSSRILEALRRETVDSLSVASKSR